MAEAATVAGYRFERRIGGGDGTGPLFAAALRGIAVDGQGRVFAVGDSAVRVFDAPGAALREWNTAEPGYSIAVDDAGRAWVGEGGRVEIFDAAGQLVETRRDAERLGLVTAIAFGAGDVFLADATARWIRRYDRAGRYLNAIGDRHRKGGFHIPNGVVDCACDTAGVVHVANPGMHRVERYRADGEPLGHFGRFDGRDPRGFGGCCNPTNLALDAAGRVVVSEKAPPRVKRYDPAGELLGVVADSGFDEAAKNMDLAVDARGRIHVADTGARQIRIYAPAAQDAA